MKMPYQISVEHAERLAQEQPSSLGARFDTRIATSKPSAAPVQPDPAPNSVSSSALGDGSGGTAETPSFAQQR